MNYDIKVLRTYFKNSAIFVYWIWISRCADPCGFGSGSTSPDLVIFVCAAAASCLRLWRVRRARSVLYLQGLFSYHCRFKICIAKRDVVRIHLSDPLKIRNPR